MSFIRKTESEIKKFREKVAKNPITFLPTFICTTNGKKPSKTTISAIASSIISGNF